MKDRINIMKDSIKLWRRAYGVLASSGKVLVLMLIILSALTAAAGFGVTITIQNLINLIQVGSSEFKGILGAFCMYMAMLFINVIVTTISGFIDRKFNAKFQYDMEKSIVEKCKMLKMIDFENAEIYDKLGRARQSGSHNFKSCLSQGMNLVRNIVTLSAYLGIIASWKPILLIVIPIVPIITAVYNRYLMKFRFDVHKRRIPIERSKNYYQSILTLDRFFKEIKFYNLNNYFINRFKKISEDFIEFDMKLLRKETLVVVSLDIIELAVTGIISLIIIQAAFAGEILLGSTMTFIKSITSIQDSVTHILSSTNAIYNNKLYIQQYFQFMDLEEEKDTSGGMKIDSIQSIELRNVSFRYRNRAEYALKNINMKIEKGENMAIVGLNGSGKTTLIKLICGVYDNYEGKILVNGIDMREYDRKEITAKTGVVFQDYNKYELTFEENVVLDLKKNEDRDYDAKLRYAIEKSDTQKIVDELKNGVDSRLGVWFEGGVQISGGEWQKVAMARTYFRNPDLFVLDEPTAALDTIAEHNLFKNVYETTKDKIVIFITHRLGNIPKIANRIIVMENGSISEEGNHGQLVEMNGIYNTMWRAQEKNIKDSENLIK